ncbi:transposase [Rhodococcus sp. HNM0563]
MRLIWPPESVTHMWDRHELTPAEVEEAFLDPLKVFFQPDPASDSGTSDRSIGFSPTAGLILTVITVRFEGRIYGATAWQSSPTQQR